MQKIGNRRLSIVQRLGLGVSFMLLPVLGLAVVSFVSFESAIATLEGNQDRMLEEQFPLVQLEQLLLEALDLLEGFQKFGVLPQQQARWIQLHQEIEQTFENLLNAPSQLHEKHRFVLEIQQSWQQAQANSSWIVKQSVHADVPDPSLADQVMVKQQVEQAIRASRRLDRLLTSFRNDDNLTQARLMKYRVRLLVAGILTLALFMAVISGLILARSILKPLKQLQYGVAKFGDGELSHRIYLNTHDELDLLAQTVNWMAENLEQNQQMLTELATMDELTKVYNRREFNRRLALELARSQREGHSVSLMMIDIDHFKKLNDTYGHQAGDEALRQVSHIIKTEVRPSDQPARYGGEEFAVILPYASRDEVYVVAERLRQHIAAHDVQIHQGLVLKVTASLGCATFPLDAQSADRLTAEADRSLYEAKDNGRNQVCQASVPLPQSRVG
ncbi:diguanylate cyclase [Synechococcales cyanobacterium C]|uniref:Diguanylate cyclase n=1 Tax=Petrachloros mirabilis ULC683 TaxID=2781853 RepID=A0A8K2A0J5_9CYAN|nr:diguanylate cyclase [Petrachloros mirabilis]NCJ07516.1 diguanylate cyclase [Petrachloros mirabilis ULC683]